MFPVAWAAAKGENNDSWIWFLKHVQQCIENLDGNRMAIISDQQKVKHTFVLLLILQVDIFYLLYDVLHPHVVFRQLSMLLK